MCTVLLVVLEFAVIVVFRALCLLVAPGAGNTLVDIRLPTTGAEHGVALGAPDGASFGSLELERTRFTESHAAHYAVPVLGCFRLVAHGAMRWSQVVDD